MKATEQYFPVVPFIMLYKVVQTFEPVDEILNCGHSNESYWAILSGGTFYLLVRGDLNFKSVDKIFIKMWPFEWKLLEVNLLSVWYSSFGKVLQF